MKWSKIMKPFLFLWLIMLIAGSINAQGIKQWFSQKSTQTEYLVQQIAALKMYGSYVQKGYKIVKGGLHTISDIKEGHLNLDRIFFDSVKVVNKSIKNDGRVKGVIQLQRQTARLIYAALKMVRSSEYFQRSDLQYVQKIGDGVEKNSERIIDELEAVLRNGEYQMSDDERLKRIDAIYKETKEQHEFVQSFCMDLKKLELQKRLELKSVKGLKNMYP
ncbi:MAG TPA: hypothetical protein PKE30_01595 [Niabella sp.]|nr:hypothetical protein [Niabella sp.]